MVRKFALGSLAFELANEEEYRSRWLAEEVLKEIAAGRNPMRLVLRLLGLNYPIVKPRDFE